MNVIARSLMQDAEAAIAAGRLDLAQEHLNGARRAEPGAVPAALRLCEVLTALGHRPEAILVCRAAVDQQRGPRQLRALVGALMSGPSAPGVEDVTLALFAARRARTAGTPWGPAADCDIATRLGDTLMSKHCLEELQLVDGQHPETRRAASLQRTPWSRGMAGLILLLATLATLVDLFTRWLRARWSSKQVTLGLVALVWAAFAPAVCPAASAEAARIIAASTPPPPAAAASGFQVDDHDPVASVPSDAQANQNPMAMGYFLDDLIGRAQAASKRGDHAAAARYYQALAKAVPERATPFVKLCLELESAGDRLGAIAACRTALGRQGATVDDHARYLRLLMGQPGALDPQQVADADASVEQLRKHDAFLLASQLECELATRIDDLARLQSCTRDLYVRDPNGAITVSFQWALALKQGDRPEALRLVERAKVVGVKPPGVAHMERATAVWSPSGRTSSTSWMATAGAIALALAGLLVVLRGRRRTRLSPVRDRA